MRRTQLMTWRVGAVAAGVLVGAVPSVVRFLPEAPAGFWSMALAALVVDVPLFGLVGREDLRIRSTLSVCFVFAIFVLFGSGPAIVVQAVAGAVSVMGQRYELRSAFHFLSRLVLAVAAAELLVDFADPRPITAPGIGLNGGDLLAFAALAVVWVAVATRTSYTWKP